MLRATTAACAPISLFHQHRKSPKAGDGLPYKHSLVIAHGMLGNANNWMSSASTILGACDAASHEGTPLVTDVYQLDMRNHGRSPWTDRHTVWDMASDIESFCQTVARKEGVDNRVVVIGHSMGGVALMHSAIRRWNHQRYLSLEPLSDEEMGIQESMEAVDAEGRGLSLMASGAGGSNSLIVGGVVVDIVPLSKSDMMDVVVDQTRLGGVVSTLDVMKALDPTKVTNNKEADAFFKDNGMDDPMMRQFVLTNLSLDLKKPSNNKWKSNVEVLHRDVNQLFIPDEMPSAGGNAKVDLDVFPMTFVFGGRSQYYSSSQRAVSHIGNYFSNIRLEETHPFPSTVSGVASLPNVTVVPNVGHNVHYEAPKEFTKKVLPMLQRCFKRD